MKLSIQQTLVTFLGAASPRLVMLLMLATAPSLAAQKIDPTEWVRRAEFNMRGNTFKGDIEMRVVRGGETREMELKLWTEGEKKAVLKIIRPAKDRNVSNLRLGYELWQYLPNLERTIKIPASMMLQSWMGSDFTNDDLVRTSSLARDYTHKLQGKQKIDGTDTLKIECLPKPDAVVVWGKVVIWLRVPDAVPIRQEFYTERGMLEKVMTGKMVQKFGTHTVPTILTMTLPKKPDHKTELIYSALVFDEPVSDQLFTQEYLKKKIQ